VNILISGSSGLIGTALQPPLQAAGHEIRRLVRRPAGSPQEIPWDVERISDPGLLEGTDAVIHLAGENLSEGRWTPERKARIRDSRVTGTRVLCEALAALERPPAAMICASAIGYYGSRGNELLTEDSPPGKGFLPDVCRAWEEAADPMRRKGRRVIHLRTGIVLSRKGGALPRMLLAFRFGVGGKIGSGEQYVSWISLDDLVSCVLFLLQDSKTEGPVNTVAPNAVTNTADVLSRAFLWRPGCLRGNGGSAASLKPASLPAPPHRRRLCFPIS
jgi:uncharacterized protein (TIGR01777 family)